MVADFRRELNVIGKEKVMEKFGQRIITGHWDFAQDIFPGQKLFTGIKTCPHAHAIIKSVDTSEAEKMPGVKAVCTYMEIPTPGMPKPAAGQTSSEITYAGMMIAAVAATDPWLAQQAAATIKAEYEVLPFVVDMEEAMKPNAPQAITGRPNFTTSNLNSKGDVAAGMAAADVRRKYTSGWASFYSHNSPETREATAQWVGDELWVWIGSQNVSNHSTNIARAMGIPETKLHLVSHGMGGGYGDRKPDGEEAWIAATLAKKAGMPVLCMDSRFVNATGGATHQYAQQATIEMGCKNDGTMTAIDAAWQGNNGPIHIRMTASKCENWRIVGTPIVTNIPRTGPFRSVTGMHGCFVTDPIFEEMAIALNMDPLDFRLKTSVDIETIDWPTDRPRSVTVMKEVINECAAKFNWKGKYHAPGARTLPDGRLHGVGMCHIVSEKGNGAPGRTVLIKACPDGSFHVNFAIGRAASGTSTACCAVVAETLGTSINNVNCTVGEALLSGMSGNQAGSTGTVGTAWASYDAAVAVRDTLFQRAANTLKTTVDQLDTKDGRVFLKSDPTKFVTHAQAIGSSPWVRHGDGSVLGDPRFFEDYGPFKEGQPTVIRTYVCNMVEVAVDPETGEMEVLDWVLVNDLGRALFPDGAQHQVDGAMIMQLAYITAWEQLFDPSTGRTINGTFLDQKNPTSLDVPVSVMKGIMYESRSRSTPYGGMGCGEPPTIPYVAFHNAFFNATGKRVTETTIGVARALKAMGKI